MTDQLRNNITGPRQEVPRVSRSWLYLLVALVLFPFPHSIRHYRFGIAHGTRSPFRPALALSSAVDKCLCLTQRPHPVPLNQIADLGICLAHRTGRRRALFTATCGALRPSDWYAPARAFHRGYVMVHDGVAALYLIYKPPLPPSPPPPPQSDRLAAAPNPVPAAPAVDNDDGDEFVEPRCHKCCHECWGRKTGTGCCLPNWGSFVDIIRPSVSRALATVPKQFANSVLSSQGPVGGRHIPEAAAENPLRPQWGFTF